MSATQLKDLVDIHFPDAEVIRVVVDNLNTHTPAMLYATFPAEEARRLVRKLEFHYTPKHGSWLNMAEIELAILADELQAAILRTKLPYVFAWIEMRRANAQAYTEAFKGSAIQTPVERPGYRHVYRNYVIRVTERTRVQQALAEAGIASKLLYVPPLHLQPAN